MSEPLKALDSLRTQGLREAQRDLAVHERELHALRVAREEAKRRRSLAESALSGLRSQFASSSLLSDLRWLELSLIGAAKDLEQALLEEGKAAHRVREAEHRLRDQESVVRQQALAKRAVSQVLERERLAGARRTEQLAEDESDDAYRSRGCL